MNKKTKASGKESGQIILFIVFVILFMVMFVSLYISKSLARHSKVSNGVINSVQAYYVADTGSENVLYYLSTMPPAATLNEGDTIPLDNALAPYGGSTMAVVSEADATTMKIDIVGTYENTSRAIQLFW